MEKNEFKIAEVINIINDLLWQKDWFICNDDVYRELKNRDKDNKNNYNYKEIIKKAWRNLREIIENTGEGVKLIEKKDGRTKRYKYPTELTSNPAEIFNGRRRKIVGQDILNIMANSKGVLPDAFMASISSQLETICEGKGTILQFDSTESRNQKMIPLLYKCVENRKVIEFEYQTFTDKKSKRIRMSPHLIKEYNLRWFVFGHVHGQSYKESHYALDRIESDIVIVNEPYVKSELDYQTYFDDIVGVTHEKDATDEDIVLRALNPEVLGYIKTKKLHQSQVIEGNIIRLHLKVNYEFVNRLLPYADRLMIEQPLSLRSRVKKWAEDILKQCE